MAIFLLVTDGGPPGSGVEGAINKHSADGVLEYRVTPGKGYLVSYNGTTQELSDLLGISDGSNGSGVVAKVSSYYGRAYPDLWEWVKTRWER